MNRKKIMSALAAGLVFGSMIAVPISSYAAEAANGSENVLNVKSTAETYREQGEKLYNEGKYEEAATAYEKAAKEEKSNDEYWFMCGLSYYMANSYQKATDYFEKAIELNPSNADSYLFCGHSWLLRGLNSVQDGSRKIGFGKPIWDFFKNACKYADRAVELASNASSTQCMAGQIAAMSGNMAKKIGFDSYFVNEFYQKAYNRYRKAIELDPNNNLAQKGFSEFIQNHPEYGSMPSAPSVQGGAGTQTVTANGDYGFVQTLGNGPVQFVPRMVHDGTARYYVAGVPANGFLNIQDRSCPPTAPDSHKPLYIIYDVDTYPSFSQNTVRAIFSYDDATNTFTLYDRYYDFSRPVRKIRIIDKDTVEGSYWDGETYSENNPLVIQFKYVNTLPDHSPDRDGCTWTGWDLENDIPAPIDVYFDIDKYVDPFYMKLSYELVYAADNNEVGLDGLFAFLARKGNVGYAPPAGSRVKYY